MGVHGSSITRLGLMEGQSHGWGEGSMEAWEGLHNTKVGVSGCMCAIRQGVGGGGGREN